MLRCHDRNILCEKYLDRTGVDDSLFIIQAFGNGVFCYHRFACTGMGRHQDTLISLDRVHGYFLEGI